MEAGLGESRETWLEESGQCAIDSEVHIMEGLGFERQYLVMPNEDTSVQVLPRGCGVGTWLFPIFLIACSPGAFLQGVESLFSLPAVP